MKVVGSPLVQSRLRLGLAFIILLMVISSPILNFSTPQPLSAKSNNVDTSGQHSAFSLEDTPSSSPLASTSPTNVSPMDSNFTTQGALSLTRAAQTSNFVLSKGYYDISFRTATAGTIKTITMDFPSDTFVGSAGVVEVVGIGPGTLAASAGGVLTYTVTNAVNVPALTNIRIQISNINNPTTPSASYAVSITTRNAANAIIDGPTNTFAYNIVQVGNAQIAPGAVTTSKIATGAVGKTDVAESFMKKVTVLDDAAGNAVGWNPDGSTVDFDISESVAVGVDSTYINLYIYFGGIPITPACRVITIGTGNFDFHCDSPPPDGSELQYVVENLPPHVVQ
jgi:hypothetical protein